MTQPYKQVYGSRTGWTFPPMAQENLGRDIPHDAETSDLEIVRQDGASRWVVLKEAAHVAS